MYPPQTVRRVEHAVFYFSASEASTTFFFVFANVVSNRSSYYIYIVSFFLSFFLSISVYFRSQSRSRVDELHVSWVR